MLFLSRFGCVEAVLSLLLVPESDIFLGRRIPTDSQVNQTIYCFAAKHLSIKYRPCLACVIQLMDRVATYFMGY